MTTKHAQSIVQAARRFLEQGVEIPVDIISELNIIVTTRSVSPDLREAADRLLHSETEW